MIQTLMLSVLSALGFMVAWARTMLKPHVVGLFIKRLRHKSFDEVTDWLAARGGLGELLNCPYCLSGYVSVAFFLAFHLLPLTLVFAVAAFFISPLLIELVLRPHWAEGVQEEETPAQATPSRPPHSDYKVAIPESIKARMEAARTDPVAHRKMLTDNQDIFSIVVTGNGCTTDACRALLEEKRRDEARLDGIAVQQNAACPDCVRGLLINKYFFLIYDAEKNTMGPAA